MTIRPSKSAAPDPKFQPYRRPEPPKKESTQSSSKQNQSQSNLSSTDTKKPSTFKKKNNNAPPPPSFKDLLKLGMISHKKVTYDNFWSQSWNQNFIKNLFHISSKYFTFYLKKLLISSKKNWYSAWKISFSLDLGLYLEY